MLQESGIFPKLWVICKIFVQLHTTVGGGGGHNFTNTASPDHSYFCVLDLYPKP